MILVDATAWIEYLRATGSPADLRLEELLIAQAPIAVTDLVLMKVLAGARDDAHRDRLRRLLARCDYWPLAAPSDFEEAADLYRLCRSAGIRVRRLPECVVAVVAMRHGAALLHAGHDFDAISRYAGLESARTLDPASPRTPPRLGLP